uniref:BZIP domain-containing protein n=1 Tax=Globodera rostochiensis TaxID=31243 RepID=A0A914H5R5_GLORO
MNSSMPANESLESTDGDESNSELRDPHSALGVEEVVNEEEARRRREQLNRRPSYRMILKDLETVGDKQLKKEMLEDGNTPNTYNHNHERNGRNTVHQLGSPDESAPFVNNNNNNIGGGGTAAATNQQQLTQHISPPTQQNLAALGQLNLIGNPAATAQQQQIRLMSAVTEMPSQPQPQQLPSTNSVSQQQQQPQPLLTAVNNLEMLGLKAPETLGAFGQNDWQNNLLSSYSRAPQQQQAPPQQQQQAPLMQQNNAGGPVGSVPSPLSMQQQQQQQHVTPPHGLGTRQGSASLTSFSPNVRSDNDDNSRKRQVRLLKNREAAKECRRKKKEYVKCLENRVAVLENQNKALIEELKTLKELYCRKEKGDLQ